MGNRRLYTEESIRALPAGSEIVLGADALATPAALDLAFVRGVRVRWDQEASGSADCDCSASPAAGQDPRWKQMLATDGEYVVKILNGRAQVFRLTSDGPVLCP